MAGGLRQAAVGAATFEHYRTIVRSHLVPAFGPLPLVKLKPLHVQS